MSEQAAGQQHLAHVSIAAPRDLLAAGQQRVDVFLREDGDAHFRWYHADGKPTVVDGRTIDHALRVAQMVWQDVRVLSRAEPQQLPEAHA